MPPPPHTSYFAYLSVCWFVCDRYKRQNGWTDWAKIFWTLMIRGTLRITKSCLHNFWIFTEFWKFPKKIINPQKILFFEKKMLNELKVGIDDGRKEPEKFYICILQFCFSNFHFWSRKFSLWNCYARSNMIFRSQILFFEIK